MGAAAFWSFVGASSLVLGALGAIWLPMPARAIGLVMGFGAGTLIGAVAYDLVLESFREGGRNPTLAGLVIGALLFWGGDWLLAARRSTGSGDLAGQERRWLRPRPRILWWSPSDSVLASDAPDSTISSRQSSDAPRELRTGGSDPVVEATVSGPSLVLGALLDGVPESLAIGVTLLGGEPVSVAMVTAVFTSNIPEGMAASVGLRQTGTPAARIVGIWAGVVVVCVAATAIGYSLLGSAPASTIAFIQAFAAGAILTVLATTLVPDAYRNGGREVGLVTVLGFIASAGLVVIGA